MVGGRIDVIVVVRVHGVVHVGRMVQTAKRRPVRHVGFVDATRRRAVDVSRMDPIIILEENKKTSVTSWKVRIPDRKGSTLEKFVFSCISRLRLCQ